MKSHTKNIPVYLYAIALLTIAALCFMIIEKSDKTVKANETVLPVTDKTYWENTSKEEPVSTQQDTNADPLPIQERETLPEPIFYTDSIPRNASIDEQYLYAQKIYGDGKTELMDVFQTSVGVFVFVKTTSKSGDVCGANPCVGIVKTDAYGNLLSSLSLTGAYAENYVTAAPTACGLTLVTTDKKHEYYYVYVLPYDLEQTTPFRINAANGGKILQTTNSFLFFAEYDSETIIYSYQNGELTFQSIHAGMICDLFEFSSYYIAYSSDLNDNSYTISKLDKKTLALLSERTVQNAQAKNVFPVSANGKQSFLLLETRNDSVYALISGNALFTEIIDTKRIGNFTLSQAYFDGADVLLVCKGNLNGIIKLSADLTAKVSETKPDFIPSCVLDSYYSGTVLYYLTSDTDGKITLVHAKDDSVYYEYFDFQTNFARIIFHLNGTFSLFYQDNDSIKIIGFRLE